MELYTKRIPVECVHENGQVSIEQRGLIFGGIDAAFGRHEQRRLMGGCPQTWHAADVSVPHFGRCGVGKRDRARAHMVNAFGKSCRPCIHFAGVVRMGGVVCRLRSWFSQVDADGGQE